MNFSRPLILASSSPRRRFLLQQVGFDFKIATPGIDESFPDSLAIDKIPEYLAKKKAKVFEAQLTEEIVIASDTVVILDEEVLNKPADRSEAIRMLSRLSGRTHRVITAVCLLSKDKIDSFDDTTEVTFRNLTTDEIERYIDDYKPYDKAGAYGAQDCLQPGVNPCSNQEIEFLKKINKPDLVEKSIANDAGEGVIIIDKINGSYFTVMGLPIHKVYSRLHCF